MEKTLAAGVKDLVVVHCKEMSFALNSKGEFTEVPSLKVPPEDIKGTVGAGDAFCAGVLYALHEGKNLEEMLRYGGASAIFNLRSASASGGAASLTEIEDFLKKN